MGQKLVTSVSINAMAIVYFVENYKQQVEVDRWRTQQVGNSN